MTAADYDAGPQNTPSRHKERARFDRATVHEVLDEAIVCHTAFVADGLPQVLPLLFVRVEHKVYLHSSTGAHLARTAARSGGVDVAVEVTLVDALVLARTAFHHSANYRSVVAHGRAELVRDQAEKVSAFAALVDKIVPGRGRDARAPNESELRQTALLALELRDVGAKVRTGPPLDDAEDLATPVWAGIVPLLQAWGVPEAAPDLAPGIAVPGYLDRGR